VTEKVGRAACPPKRKVSLGGGLKNQEKKIHDRYLVQTRNRDERGWGRETTRG